MILHQIIDGFTSPPVWLVNAVKCIIISSNVMYYTMLYMLVDVDVEGEV